VLAIGLFMGNIAECEKSIWQTKKSILTTKGAKSTKKGLLALRCLDMNENLNPVNLVNPV
jgi:hypothetical protein